MECGFGLEFPSNSRFTVSSRRKKIFCAGDRAATAEGKTCRNVKFFGYGSTSKPGTSVATDCLPLLLYESAMSTETLQQAGAGDQQAASREPSSPTRPRTARRNLWLSSSTAPIYLVNQSKRKPQWLPQHRRPSHRQSRLFRPREVRIRHPPAARSRLRRGRHEIQRPSHVQSDPEDGRWGVCKGSVQTALRCRAVQCICN